MEHAFSTSNSKNNLYNQRQTYLSSNKSLKENHDKLGEFEMDKLENQITQNEDEDSSNEIYENDGEIEIEYKFCEKLCFNISQIYKKISESVMWGMHSVAVHIIVLISTLFALFNADFKILLFDLSTDHTFNILNEIIFCLLSFELLLLILFKPKYIGSMFFYLDFLAVVSMIPDTEFIMHALVVSEAGSHVDLDTTNHLIKASSASQAGARASRYLKIIRLFTFIKIIRLAKVIETAKELKHHPVVIDVSKVTLSEVTIDKRKEKRASLKKTFDDRPRRESVSKKKLRRILSTHHANRPRRSLFHPESPGKAKVVFSRDSSKHNTMTSNSPSKQSYDQNQETPSTKMNVISFGVRNPKIILNNCNLKVYNVTNNYHVLNTQQLTENLNSQENLKTYEHFEEKFIEKFDYENFENCKIVPKNEAILKFEEDSQSDTFNTEINFSSYYNDIVGKNEEINYVEVIRHEHIDILDEEEKIKIENGIFSERELDYFCNPLQRELDVFLEKNAIDVAELIEDKSLILIDEVENNSNYFNYLPKKLLKKISFITPKTKKSLNNLLTIGDQPADKTKNDQVIHEKKSQILKSPTTKKLSYMPQNKIFKLENNFPELSDLNKLKFKHSKSLKSSLFNKTDKNLDGLQYEKEEIHKPFMNQILNKPKLLRKSTYSNDMIVMSDSFTNTMKNKLKRKFSITSIIKENDEDLNLKDQKSKDFNNSYLNSSLSKSHFSSSCDSIPTHNFKKRKTEEVIIIENQDTENLECIATRKDTFTSLTIKAPVKASLNFGKIIKKKDSVLLKKNKLKKINKPIKSKEGHQSLEDTLNSKLTSKLVVLIMFLMVVFPILDPDYINILFGSSEDDATVEFFCVNSLDDAFLKSINNTKYLPVLQKYWLNCLDAAEDGPSLMESNNTLMPYFLFFNFTNYMPYFELRKILKEKNINMSLIPDEIYIHPYYDYLNKHKRSNLNYKKRIFDNGDNFNSSINFVCNNNKTTNVESLLNILKIVFIAIFLLTGALIFSNDIHYFVIIPLDKVMIRLKLYLNNTDKLDEEIDMESFDKMDIQSAYKKALLLLDKKGHDEKISYKKNETNSIDKNIMALIHLISISIGKPILNIISKSDIQKSLAFDLKQQGISFKSVILMMKISNTDRFVTKYKEKALKIISKIHSIYHEQAIIHQGDIYLGKDIILWKEDRDNVLSKFKLYIYKLLKSRSSKSNEKIRQAATESENQKQQNNNNDNKFEFSKENIHNISFFCTLKILHAFMKKIPRTLQILKYNGVKINFLLSYGDVYQGYIGETMKIEEVYSSPLITESEKVLKKINENYEELSGFLHTTFSENLNAKLYPLIFPCELLKTEFEGNFSKIEIIDKIHCTYNFSGKLEHRVNDVKLKFNKEFILQERKMILSNLCSYSGRLEDYIMSAKIIDFFFNREECNLHSEFMIFFDFLRKNKLNECIVSLRRIRKNNQYAHFQEPSFKKRLKKIEKNVKNKINDINGRFNVENYTISMKN